MTELIAECRALMREGKLSFRVLELKAFMVVMREVRRVVCELLGVLDEDLRVGRGKGRHEVVGLEERVVDALVGELRFKRRRYRERGTGRNVYLLDEALGMGKRQRVSGGLARLAVLWATEGSYRGVRERLKGLGYPPISHEGVRRQALRLGERIRAGGEGRVAAGGEGGRVETVFLGADGFFVPMQGGAPREVKMAVAYQGWERRQGAGETADYTLVRPWHHSTTGGAEGLWAVTYSALSCEFDLERSTVILCGDDAGWIREGARRFPHCVFQRDRYHVARDVGEALAHLPRRRQAAMRALEAGDVAAVAGELGGGWEETPSGPSRDRLSRLAVAVAAAAHEIEDYRSRLRSAGHPVRPDWRGPGVAESQVKRYKQRLGGRSWSIAGLQPILALLDRRLDGTLEDALAGLDAELDLGPLEPQGLTAGQVPLAVGHGTPGARQAHFPALDGAHKGFAPLLRDVGRIRPV